MASFYPFAPRKTGSKGPKAAEICKGWPVDPNDYELLEECGRGGCSVVFKGVCKPSGDLVAIKRTNLEGTSASDLAAVVKEASLMRRLNHPNILQLYTSFVYGAELWMVMPYMGAGSVRDIMRKHYPQGLPEAMIATISREVLKGLEYMHRNGGIHRDVKAANILMGEDGSCLLADFGVAAVTWRGASAINLAASAAAVMRSTFVGTPLWMAPEVVAQASGYDATADVWSFGITLLELATGRPPFSRCSPMRALVQTVQGPAPTLAQALADAAAGHPQGPFSGLGMSGKRSALSPDGGESSGASSGGGGSAAAAKQAAQRFSKAAHELVSLCLEKDPTERPSAEELLHHKFFKQARDKEYLRCCFMEGEPRSPRAAGTGNTGSGGFIGGLRRETPSPRASGGGSAPLSSSPRDGAAQAAAAQQLPHGPSVKSKAFAALNGDGGGSGGGSGMTASQKQRQVPPGLPKHQSAADRPGGFGPCSVEPLSAEKPCRAMSSWNFDNQLVMDIRNAASAPCSPREGPHQQSDVAVEAGSTGDGFGASAQPLECGGGASVGCIEDKAADFQGDSLLAPVAAAHREARLLRGRRHSHNVPRSETLAGFLASKLALSFGRGKSAAAADGGAKEGSQGSQGGSFGRLLWLTGRFRLSAGSRGASGSSAAGGSAATAGALGESQRSIPGVEGRRVGSLNECPGPHVPVSDALPM